jgi:uncharacterized BrkB/YihY/UPF0761 family membrane protein
VLVPIGTIVTNYVTGRAERILVETGVTKGSPSTTAPIPTTQKKESVVSSARYAVGIVVWQVTRFGLAALFMFWVVALVYHFGPNVKQRFRLLTPGSMFTVMMWTLLAIVFRVYVDTFGKYGQTYGAVGGVIILLFFFYLDALVLLVGAEINSEVDAALRAAHHERIKPPPPSETEDTRPVKDTP